MTGGPSRWLAVLDRVDTTPANNDLPPSGRERFPLVPGVLFPSRSLDFAVTPSRYAATQA